MAKPKKAKGKKGGDAGKNDEQKDKVLEVDKEWYLIQIRSEYLRELFKYGPTQAILLVIFLISSFYVPLSNWHHKSYAHIAHL